MTKHLWKYTFKTFGIYIFLSFLLMLSTSILMELAKDIFALQLVIMLFCAAALFLFFFNNARQQGLKDALARDELDEKGDEMIPEARAELESIAYRPQNGFLAGFIAGAPGILAAIIICLLPRAMGMIDTLIHINNGFWAGNMPILELIPAPESFAFLSLQTFNSLWNGALYAFFIYNTPLLFPYYFIPMSLVMPLVVGFSYRMGPKMSKEIDRAIWMNERRARRKKIIQ